MPVGSRRLDAALDAAGLRIAIGVELLAQHDVVRDHEPIDSRRIRATSLIEEMTPAAHPRILGGKILGLER